MKRGRHHLNTKDRTGACLRELVLLNLGVIVLGVLMLCFPGASGVIICRTVGVLLAVWGVGRGVAYFVTAREMVLGSFALAQGALLVGFGVCFLVRPGVLAAFLTIALAVVLLVGGVMKLQYAIELSGLGVRGWWIELLGAALMVILGIVAFVNPFKAGEALMMFLGAAFVVDGAWDLASVICISALARKVRRREEQMAADARAQASALEVDFISRED